MLLKQKEKMRLIYLNRKIKGKDLLWGKI